MCKASGCLLAALFYHIPSPLSTSLAGGHFLLGYVCLGFCFHSTHVSSIVSFEFCSHLSSHVRFLACSDPACVFAGGGGVPTQHICVCCRKTDFYSSFPVARSQLLPISGGWLLAAGGGTPQVSRFFFIVGYHRKSPIIDPTLLCTFSR